MSSLYDYLNASAHRDRDTAWGWQCNPEIPVLGRDDFLPWLAADSMRASATLLPISGWYQKYGTPHQSEQERWVDRTAHETGLCLNSSVKKLLYTDATKGKSGTLLQPSWFASPEIGPDTITQGKHYILADDTIASGSTIRDLVKHINLRGGVVDAVVETGVPICSTPEYTFGQASRNQEAARFLDIYDALAHGKLQTFRKLCSLSNNMLQGVHQESCEQIIREANAYLHDTGLSWDQLTCRDFRIFQQRLRGHPLELPFSMDAFWKAVTADIDCNIPIPIKDVERRTELSELLKTEPYQEQWTGTTQKTGRTR